MSDDLDVLAAALRAVPSPEADAKAAALRLAMDNFDRLQGSGDPLRPNPDRPVQAGLTRRLRAMLKSLTLKQALAVSTSVAGLVVGVAVLPSLLVRAPQVVPVEVTLVTEAELKAMMPPTKVEVPVQAGKPRARPEGIPEVDHVSAMPMSDAQANVLAPEQAGKLRARTEGIPEVDHVSAMPMSDAQAIALAPEQAGKLRARTEAPVDEARQADAEAEAVAVAQAAADAQAEAFAMAEAAPCEGRCVSGSARMGINAAEEGDAGGTNRVRITFTASGETDGGLSFGDLAANVAPNSESFANAPANPVQITAESPVSTFSIDVDTASYAVLRSSLNAGSLPDPEAVRIEEMINYFPYDYPKPEAGQAFRPSVTVMPTPWNKATRLVHLAIQGAAPQLDDRPPLNLVFLIDTSGSMDEPNKLPLLKQSLALMLGQLRPEDQVAIVAYAGSAGLVLPATKGTDRAAIMAALNQLAAGGGTAGAEGLELAYQVAESMTAKGEVSRVLLATDGDFNVGIDDPEALETYIAVKRDGGTYLSVLGFGRGNLDDATMQALAQNGNGTASYIDSLSEAQKVLVDQLTGALYPIADNVKIQVEWNPAQVAEYRLIGYETRALRREDFNNDAVDAGDIGAGTQVTAIYEITAPGSSALRLDPLRYGKAVESEGGAEASGELGYLRLRAVAPGESESRLFEVPIVAGGAAGDEARFAAAIAGFGQLLKRPDNLGNWLGDWGWDQAIELAQGARGEDAFGYRAEAVTLMRLAQSLAR